MDWREFTMNLGTLEAEQVEQVFARHGALSVTYRDAGDDPVLEPAPGETPFWSQTRITGLFNADVDLLSLREDLLHSFRLDDLPDNRIDSLKERDWVSQWQDEFRPMQFGTRLWVCPHNKQVDAEDAVVVSLDPGLAFGTGTHETTAMCLEWLDRLDLRGLRVLDYGCGSGILSIAALLLGADTVDAIDIDGQAITASRQNAVQNGVGDRLTLMTQASEIKGPYDIVIANILAGTLQELGEDISKRTVHGGHIALSGILSGQTDEIAGAYERWFTLDAPLLRNGWARITGTRN